MSFVKTQCGPRKQLSSIVTRAQIETPSFTVPLFPNDALPSNVGMLPDVAIGSNPRALQ